MKRYHPFRLLSLLLLLLAAMPGNAQPAPAVFDGQAMRIGKHLEIFSDSSRAMNIEAIAQMRFSPSGKETPNFDFSRATCWLRFRLSNQHTFSQPYLQVEYPLLDSLVLYRKLATGGFERLSKVGMALPFKERDYPSVNFILNLPVPRGATEEFYLKVNSTGQVILPLTVLPRHQISAETNTRNLITGGYIGVLLVMIVYNLFIYFSIRERSYIHLVIYIIFIGLSQLMLSGYGLYLLFPEDPALHHFFIIGFPAISGITAILFIRSFLEIDGASRPVANRVLLGIAFLYGLAPVLRLLGWDMLSSRNIDVAGLLGAVAVYVIVIPMALRRSRPAIFLLISWTLFIIGLVLFIMRNFNLLPFNIVTSYTMQMGTAAMVALLAIAIADKLNVLEKERKLAQQQALEQARENERIIREQNVMLEEKVTARTAELAEAFDDLKHTQAQLVEQEKMASLGQLTAGIAHEINNPINFVTSNVRPLQRDIDILLDGFDRTAAIALSGEAVQRPEVIAKLREEMDFDYLKEEIGFLLKGIHEGSERTAEIVKGLRIFSRVDESDLKKTNILDGLDSTAIIVNTLLNNRIVLQKNYAPIPLIECYPGKLNQVFLNIISNGIYAVNKQWGERPGGQITITTTALNNDYVRVAIADNGIGMDEETKRKLFEPFFTTKEVGEGTGLGMSIVYNIIRRHNGNIYVHSEPGKGTEFVIDLPILQPTLPSEN